MEKYEVEIRSENVLGYIHVVTDYADTLVNASRIIITYHPKRGYTPFHFAITKIETLI